MYLLELIFITRALDLEGGGKGEKTDERRAQRSPSWLMEQQIRS